MKLRFERGQASADELQEVIDEILAELRAPDSEAARQANLAGIDPAEFGAASVKAEEAEQCIDPLVTPIVVGIAVKLGSDVILKAWDRIVWPRIEKRLGGLALGDQLADEPGEDEQAEHDQTEAAQAEDGRAEEPRA